jgi:single-strand DNA-binding protein
VKSINRVVLTGGVARDLELRNTPGGTSVATMRIAFTTQRRVDGEWQEKSNFIDVELWGTQAENAARHLAKGRQVAVDGRLEWIEYETQDGVKRQLHKVVADSVQYLAAGARRVESPAAEPSGSESGIPTAGTSRGNEGIPF